MSELSTSLNLLGSALRGWIQGSTSFSSAGKVNESLIVEVGQYLSELNQKSAEAGIDVELETRGLLAELVSSRDRVSWQHSLSLRGHGQSLFIVVM
jgi:hypothetical protein